MRPIHVAVLSLLVPVLVAFAACVAELAPRAQVVALGVFALHGALRAAGTPLSFGRPLLVGILGVGAGTLVFWLLPQPTVALADGTAAPVMPIGEAFVATAAGAVAAVAAAALLWRRPGGDVPARIVHVAGLVTLGAVVAGC